MNTPLGLVTNTGVEEGPPLQMEMPPVRLLPRAAFCLEMTMSERQESKTQNEHFSH